MNRSCEMWKSKYKSKYVEKRCERIERACATETT